MAGIIESDEVQLIRGVSFVRLLVLLSLSFFGCSTGFGEKCDVPRAESFQNACFTPAEDESTEESGSNLEQEAVSSCAIQNYAGCSTRICLIFRGSDAFCSERCVSDGDCEGSAVCAPMIGERQQDGTCTGECYCIRQADLDR